MASPTDEYQSEKEDSFDLNKFNRRENTDSVDTLDLLRESDENFTDGQIVEGVTDDENYSDENDDEKTLSYQSAPTSPHLLQNENISATGSCLSVISDPTSTKSSLHNIEAQMKPLTESLSQQLVPLPTNESNNEIDSDDEVETADLENLEPKLRDAWIKMRKLDLRLVRCTQKERSVKRETIALIERNRAELAQLRADSNHKETKWEAENTAHFLALSYVDLDDEVQNLHGLDFGPNGGGVGARGHEALATPLFKTEMPYDCDNVSLADEGFEVKNQKKSQHSTKTKSSINNNNNNNNNFGTSGNINNKNGKVKGENKSEKAASGSNNKPGKDDKVNFIKRNIQLAQDAAGPLAMTDLERQRLDELLIDLDKFDISQNSSQPDSIEPETNTHIVEYNPFSVSLAPGDGFTPDEHQAAKLRDIDTRLERRMSRINSCINGSVASSSRLSTTTKKSNTTQHTIDAEVYLNLLQTTTNNEVRQVRLNDDFDENEFGDRFIREARVSREQEIKLKQIEQQLERIKSGWRSSETDIQSESSCDTVVPLVGDDMIKDLIEEFKLENRQMLKVNGKLGTLREEEGFFDEEEENFLESGMRDTPRIHESILSSLIEQARLEGIVSRGNNNDIYETDSAINTYYEEAMEVIRAKRENKITNHLPVSDDEDEYEELTSDEIPSQEFYPTLEELDMKTVSLMESQKTSKKLPPLSESESRPISAVSTTSSCISSLPKIDSRFLPK